MEMTLNTHSTELLCVSNYVIYDAKVLYVVNISFRMNCVATEENQFQSSLSTIERKSWLF